MPIHSSQEKQQPARGLSESPRLFPTTSHTLVFRVQSSDAKVREVSLARFCTLYYPAIYGYARMRGLTVEDAQDRTQDFFVEVVKDELLLKYDLKRGSKLSSWLMKCFKNLDLNHRAYVDTDKRGGRLEFVSFDTDFAERGFKLAHAAHLGNMQAADLMLARSLWREAEQRLRERYAGQSNEALVSELIPNLLFERWPEPPALSQSEVAAKHGTTTVRLKAFFNRTLRVQAERFFAESAAEGSPGISPGEIDELWGLMKAHLAE